MRLLFGLLFLTVNAYSQNVSTLFINHDWVFRCSDSLTCYKAEVPGNVHRDLLSNKLIPDPFVGLDETKVQWIEKKDWVYETSFDIPDLIFNKKFIELQFEGLDTYAEVYLNDTLILSANNMFRSWKVEIKAKTNSHQYNNRLTILFHSPINFVMDKCLKNGFVYPADNDCDTCKTSVFTRKSALHYGWDFAPRLLTSGISKNVKLFGCDSNLSTSDHQIISKNKIEFINQKDSSGRNFYFLKNGISFFIKGVNYIPVSKIHQAKTNYKYLFNKLKEANVNMIRVWGGGIYEDEEFYNLADSFDILIWQDLMYANTFYPHDSAILCNEIIELDENVKRLKKHPSVVLFCGNNEIDVASKNWGWKQKYKYSDSVYQKLLTEYDLKFNKIFSSKFDDLKLNYIPTSPQSNWGNLKDFNFGDNHFWGVWHGEMPFESYLKYIPRFMSEYGFPSFPSYQSIKYFNGSTNFNLNDSTINFHQKSYKGNKLILKYHDWYYPKPKYDSDYVWTSQLLQADAYKIASEAHRRAKPFCMGTMLWQLNDYWPGITWSIIDFEGVCKPAYFRIKDGYKTILVSPIVENDTVKVYAVSDSIQNFIAELKIELIDFSGSKIFEERKNCLLKNDSGVLVFEKAINYFPKFDKQKTFLKTTLSTNNIQLATNLLYFDTLKNLKLETANIRFSVIKLGKHKVIKLKSSTLCKGVFLYHPFLTDFSDNGFDLLPNEEKIIQIETELTEREIKSALIIKSLNQIR